MVDEWQLHKGRAERDEWLDLVMRSTRTDVLAGFVDSPKRHTNITDLRPFMTLEEQRKMWEFSTNVMDQTQKLQGTCRYCGLRNNNRTTCEGCGAPV